jgi:CheY-like chemotaxis protein
METARNTSIPTPKLRILLVEDHNDTADFMKLLLAGFGHVAELACSYEQALEQAAKAPFDLLLCDIGLPDGTGYDLLRELQRRYAIKGIALTGYGTTLDLEKATEAGFDCHLLKPLDCVELQKSIAKVCAR